MCLCIRGNHCGSLSRLRGLTNGPNIIRNMQQSKSEMSDFRLVLNGHGIDCKKAAP